MEVRPSIARNISTELRSAKRRPSSRHIYYGTLAALGLGVLLTPYPLSYSGFLIVQGLLLAIVLYGLIALYWLNRERPERPVAALWQLARAEGLADRLALFMTGTLFLTWLPPLKAMIPSYAGFWADAPLAEFERSILGRDAFDVLHSMTPDSLLTAIDVGYSTWPLTVVLAMGGIVFLSENPGRFIIAWAFSWVVLGVGLATALASAGPIFGSDLGYGFGQIAPALDGTLAMRIKNNLWQVHSTGSLRLGGGISAAPSMHCAISFLLMFAAWSTRWRIPAILYAAFIWFGSVYLGWHYALDGLISLIGVAVIWRIADALCAQEQLSVERLTPALG